MLFLVSALIGKSFSSKFEKVNSLRFYNILRFFCLKPAFSNYCATFLIETTYSNKCLFGSKYPLPLERGTKSHHMLERKAEKF